MSQVWLITGSARGLGRELAKAVLDGGQRLVATARTPEDLQDLVDRYGERVRAVKLDVSDEAAARNAVAVAISQFKRLDVVVNNAGYANVNAFEDMSPEDFRAQIETNFFGVVNVTRAALPVMREQRGGHIIQISSLGDRIATPGVSAYQSAKWAVGGFSEVLAREVSPLGIHVTVVEPGSMSTDWSGSSMRVGDIRDDYQPSVGELVRLRNSLRSSAQSDPAKVAKAILQVAAEPRPPMRLLAGSDAVFMASIAAEARAKEDEKWRALSLSTDYEERPDFAETPIAQNLKSAIIEKHCRTNATSVT